MITALPGNSPVTRKWKAWRTDEGCVADDVANTKELLWKDNANSQESLNYREMVVNKSALKCHVLERKRIEDVACFACCALLDGK